MWSQKKLKIEGVYVEYTKKSRNGRKRKLKRLKQIFEVDIITLLKSLSLPQLIIHLTGIYKQ